MDQPSVSCSSAALATTPAYAHSLDLAELSVGLQPRAVAPQERMTHGDGNKSESFVGNCSGSTINTANVAVGVAARASARTTRSAEQKARYAVNARTKRSRCKAEQAARVIQLCALRKNMCDLRKENDKLRAQSDALVRGLRPHGCHGGGVCGKV